jgi:hypothetical protein
MKRSIKTMLAFVLGASSISMLAGLQELELKRIVAEKKLNRRYAIAQVNIQAAHNAVTAAEKVVTEKQAALDRKQVPATTGWYGYFCESSPLQKAKEHADAEYELAQQQLAAATVAKTSEDKVAQAQQALDRAALRVEQERLRLTQKEMTGEQPSATTSWSMPTITMPTITAQRVGLVTGGAAVLYLLWQSRTWEGWQHIKNLEFRKLKDCIALKMQLLGKKVGLVKDDQTVKTQPVKAQKKQKKQRKK